MQCQVEGESSGIGMEGIRAKVCYCMAFVEIRCFEYLNLTRRVRCKNCDSHEICEICEIHEGHDVKSSKGFERVVLVRFPRLKMKSLRIEQMAQHENSLPIVLTVHKCSHQDQAGMHTEGSPLTMPHLRHSRAER